MTSEDPGPVLSEHRGVVDAPPDQIRALLLDVRPGQFAGADVPLVLGEQGDRRVVITGGPEVFRASLSGVPVTIEVDRAAGWVQARGEWWWCGRFRVEDGSIVRQQTFNLARGPAGRLVPFTIGRGHRRAGEKALQRVLDDLSQRLGCAARMLPGDGTGKRA